MKDRFGLSGPVPGVFSDHNNNIVATMVRFNMDCNTYVLLIVFVKDHYHLANSCFLQRLALQCMADKPQLLKSQLGFAFLVTVVYFGWAAVITH